MATRGTKVFFIDNMGQITNNVKASETNNEQKRVITKLVKFAEIYNVHVFMICHLNKSGETITGAYEQENLVDTILFFQRLEETKDPEKTREKMVKRIGITEHESQLVTAIIKVQKIRDRGMRYLSLLTWNQDRGRSIDLVYDMRLNRIATSYIERGFDCIKASTIQTEYDQKTNQFNRVEIEAIKPEDDLLPFEETEIVESAAETIEDDDDNDRTGKFISHLNEPMEKPPNETDD